MRVLYWAGYLPPDIGGGEIWGRNLIRALRARGYEFVAITSHGAYALPDETELEGIPVHRFSFEKALWDRDLKRLRDITRRVAEIKRAFRPDLIHINCCQPSLFFHQRTETAYPSSTLVTVHEPLLFTSEDNSLLGRVLRSADWVTAVSAAILSDVRQFVPELTDRSSAILNCLEMPATQPTVPRFDEPRLLCLGRMFKEKGFDLALDAFAMLIKRFPRARLVIAGDGPVKHELEQQAASLGLNGAVIFTGWVEPEAVPDLMNKATLIVMPSRWREPFGLVALQAAQMARPIVASRVGGLPEVVLHGRTGLLVENENAAAIAQAITFLLDHPDEAKQMGQAARRRAQEKFDVKYFMASYEGIYQRLIKKAA